MHKNSNHGFFFQMTVNFFSSKMQYSLFRFLDVDASFTFRKTFLIS